MPVATHSEQLAQLVDTHRAARRLEDDIAAAAADTPSRRQLAHLAHRLDTEHPGSASPTDTDWPIRAALHAMAPDHDELPARIGDIARQQHPKLTALKAERLFLYLAGWDLDEIRLNGPRSTPRDGLKGLDRNRAGVTVARTPGGSLTLRTGAVWAGDPLPSKQAVSKDIHAAATAIGLVAPHGATLRDVASDGDGAHPYATPGDYAANGWDARMPVYTRDRSRPSDMQPEGVIPPFRWGPVAPAFDAARIVTRYAGVDPYWTRRAFSRRGHRPATYRDPVAGRVTAGRISLDELPDRRGIPDPALADIGEDQRLADLIRRLHPAATELHVAAVLAATLHREAAVTALHRAGIADTVIEHHAAATIDAIRARGVTVDDLLAD